MTRVTWDAATTRLYQTGIDRGMLYAGTDIPVFAVWNGLVGVTESPEGGDPQEFFLDGRKILSTPSGQDYKATIEAFSSPIEFAPCAGLARISTGLFAVDQPKQPFGFSYRTMIGNDVAGLNFGYRIHLVYNAMAQVSSFAAVSIGATSEAKTHSWDVTACPITVPSRRPAAHFIFDTRFISKTAVTRIEEILYGDDDNDPRLLTASEIVSMQLIENSIFSGGVVMDKMGVSGVSRNYLRAVLHKPHLSGTG